MIHVNLTVSHVHLTSYLTRSCHGILHPRMFFIHRNFLYPPTRTCLAIHATLLPDFFAAAAARDSVKNSSIR